MGAWQRLWDSAHTLLSPDAPRRPTFTAQLDPNTTGASQRGLLLCRVDSDPPAQLRLLHRGRVVASALPSGGSCSTCGSCSPRTKVTRAPNLLRVEIEDPVLEDEGVYICEASNILGNASASANFNAQGEAGQGEVAWSQGLVLGTLFICSPQSEEGQSIGRNHLLSAEGVQFAPLALWAPTAAPSHLLQTGRQDHSPQGLGGSCQG